ncbi:MAG TPA: V-type ATP synthase subunit F [Gemmatimonadaceae bacterium]|nr:V-type ATP synthase subunit F [Gemmatimonadaceae bacterium]
MSYRVRGLTSPALARGFQIAGIATDTAESDDEASRRLSNLAAEPTMGVILMEQSLFDRVPSALRRDLARRPLPIIVPVPSPAREVGVTAAERYVLELLRRAIGYHVRLR